MQTVPHCPAKWTFFDVLAHYAMCCTSWALSGLFMFYIFGYLSDAILYLLLREIYPCWHSTLVNVCTEEDEDDPYFDSSAFFSFYKTALKLSESEEKGQCDGHSTRIFFLLLRTLILDFSEDQNPKKWANSRSCMYPN